MRERERERVYTYLRSIIHMSCLASVDEGVYIIYYVCVCWGSD